MAPVTVAFECVTNFNISSHHVCEVGKIYCPHFTGGELRLGETRGLVHGHTGSL